MNEMKNNLFSKIDTSQYATISKVGFKTIIQIKYLGRDEEVYESVDRGKCLLDVFRDMGTFNHTIQTTNPNRNRPNAKYPHHYFESI